MADRTDFYFRQKVTEAELDLAFALLEKADRNLAADIGVYGIISGAEPTPHTPVPDLTIDLTAPARAYDNLGQRIFFGTGQVVNSNASNARPRLIFVEVADKVCSRPARPPPRRRGNRQRCAVGSHGTACGNGHENVSLSRSKAGAGPISVLCTSTAKPTS